MVTLHPQKLEQKPQPSSPLLTAQLQLQSSLTKMKRNFLPINPPNSDLIVQANNLEIIPQVNIIPHNGPALPDETIPCHSNHIAEKSEIPGPSWLKRAVQESTNSAIRLKTMWAEWKKTLQDIQEEETHNASQIVEDVAVKERHQAFRTLNIREGKVEQIKQVLSTISEMTKIDPSTLEFKDEPKTWEKAKQSVNAKYWEEGYHDELKSLKSMGALKEQPTRFMNSKGVASFLNQAQQEW